MLIRDEQPADAAALHALTVAAFGRAAEADLVDALRRDGDGVISLVAVAEGAVVGHVLLSRMSAPFRALGLAPVSVAPGRQRAGLGSRLIRAALDRAREIAGPEGAVLATGSIYLIADLVREPGAARASTL